MSPGAVTAHGERGEREKCFPAIPIPSPSPTGPFHNSQQNHHTSVTPAHSRGHHGMVWAGKDLKAHPGPSGSLSQLAPRPSTSWKCGNARSNPSWKTPIWDHKEAEQPSVARAKIWTTPQYPSHGFRADPSTAQLPPSDFFQDFSVPFLPLARSSAGICCLIPRSCRSLRMTHVTHISLGFWILFLLQRNIQLALEQSH